MKPYIIFSLHSYSYKAGEGARAPKKIYVVDSGFITAKAVQSSPDFGNLLENLVFMEMVKECSNVQELVQVVYAARNSETEKWEVKALIEASGELGVKNLMILTWNEKKEVEQDGLTVKFIPVWERFLNVGR